MLSMHLMRTKVETVAIDCRDAVDCPAEIEKVEKN